MDTAIQIGGIILGGALMAWLLVPLAIRWGVARAKGNASLQLHHTHHEVISRLGGLTVAVPFAVTALIILVFKLPTAIPRADLAIVVCGSLAMFAVGFWDDLRPLGARLKLVWQLLVALAVWWGGIRIQMFSNPWGPEPFHLGAWSVAVTMLWLVAFTNLINLIDGLDGLAGGLSLMLVGLLCFLFSRGGAVPILGCVLLGSLIVFLRYNFPPARIYLGDGGAYFLGFTLGVLTIVSSHKGTVIAALIAPLIVLTLPMIDVSLAILRRGLKGLPVFRPDKGHIHHRLLEMGLSRRRAVLGMYAFTLLFLVLGLVILWGEGRTLPIVLGFGSLCLLLVAGRFDFSREWFAVGRVFGNTMRIRQEVAFALSVTRWLEMEAQRVRSVDEFWNVMVFGAQRLGFSAMVLELPDGRREAGEASSGVDSLHRRFNFAVQGAGVLEVQARLCDAQDSGSASPDDCREDRRCIGDRRVFEIVSELFAEAWHKASNHLRVESQQLQFANMISRRPARDGGLLRRMFHLNKVTGRAASADANPSGKSPHK